MGFASVAALYAEYAGVSSDMRDHCLTLRRLAAECGLATEFGVRGGISTAALLAGVTDAGGYLTSYDVDPCHGARQAIEPVAGGRWRFVQGSSLDVWIQPTSLLMIDTVHSGNHLWQELVRHEGQVGRYLVMHDTEEFGRTGDDGGEGLWSCLFHFLAYYPQWVIHEHHKHLHGLTVLRRGNGG